MMRFVLPALAFLAAAPALGAQDDYELANALAERSWNDLATELFERIRDNTTLQPDQRAEGDYGLARIIIISAQKSDSTDEKSRLFDTAIQKVEGFLEKYPAHKRRGEALSDIAYLYQSKGKALIAAGKADPTKLKEGEEAFGAAQKRFTALIAQLKKEEKKSPEPGSKDQKAIAEYEAWEEKMMDAKFNFATSLFSHAETLKDNPSKHADMKRLLEQMIKFLTDDFLWLYEQYLIAYEASIYIGRAYQLLAETSDRERSDEYWRQCFINIGRAKSLLSDKKNRDNEAVREVVGRSLLYEIKARIGYGDIKRGQTGLKQYTDGAKIADDFFKMFPNYRFEEMGKLLRLEQARALCKSGKTKEGVTLLQELAKANKDTWVENLAIDYLGEYAGAESSRLAIDAADNFMDRGPAFYYKAIQKYRKAIQSSKKPEELKDVAYCWTQLGKCYFLLGRHYEATAALSMLEKPPHSMHEKAGEAVMRKLTSLGKIAQATKDPADQKAFEDYRAWVGKAFPNAATDGLLRQTAIDFDDKRQYDKAAGEWEKLARPGKDAFEEAVFSVGFSWFNHGQELFKGAAAQRVQSEKDKLVAQGKDAWDRALKAFKAHLAEVDKMPAKDGRVLKRAIGSVHFATKLLSSERMNKPEEALAVSGDLDRRFPTADPRLAMSIMSSRIDAKLKLGQVQEAEEDLKALKAKYEKEGIGSDNYSRALAVLASAFEEEAEKKKKAGDQELYEIYAIKAANFYYEYYVLNPKAGDKPDQMEAMADKLFMAAEQRMKMGEAKLGKEGLEEARKIYEKSRELYGQILLSKERTLPKDQVQALRGRITRCFLMTGQFEEAIKIYREITKDDTQMIKGNAWEELSDCYVEKAKSLPKGGERNDFLKQADRVYAQLSALLISTNTLNEHTYRLLYKHAWCLFELDPDGCRRFFDSMRLRGYSPAWDVDEKGASKWGFKAKFDELSAQLDKILPPKK